MAASERVTGSPNPYLPVRTRWFDDAVAAAVADGIDQVVLLGAGMDTRAFRLPLPPDLDWYEVDHAPLFAVKEPVLAAAGAVARCRRHTVVADVTGDLLAALAAAGFRAGRRTAWVAEGLLYYLTPAQVDTLLRTLAGAGAPGSRLLADLTGTGRLEEMQATRLRHGVRDLPPPYGHDDPAALLAATGWGVHSLTWAGAPDANFGRFAGRPPVTPGTPEHALRRRSRAHLLVART
jgi:methyltransferase (TIGR00027 family)